MSSRGEGESNSKARNEHLQPQLCRPCHLCKSVPLSSWDAPSSRTGSQLSTPAGHASVQDPRGHAASLGVPVPYTYVCCVPRGKDGRQTVLRVTTHLFHSLSLSIVHSSSSSPQHSEHSPRRDTLTHGQPQHPPTPPLGGPSNTPIDGCFAVGERGHRTARPWTPLFVVVPWWRGGEVMAILLPQNKVVVGREGET